MFTDLEVARIQNAVLASRGLTVTAAEVRKVHEYDDVAPEEISPARVRAIEEALP